MYKHLGDLIEFTIFIGIGIWLISRWKKTKKGMLLWMGLILIVGNFIRGGIAVNDFFKSRQIEKAKQEFEQVNKGKIMDSLKRDSS